MPSSSFSQSAAKPSSKQSAAPSTKSSDGSEQGTTSKTAAHTSKEREELVLKLPAWVQQTLRDNRRRSAQRREQRQNVGQQRQTVLLGATYKTTTAKGTTEEGAIQIRAGDDYFPMMRSGDDAHKQVLRESVKKGSFGVAGIETSAREARAIRRRLLKEEKERLAAELQAAKIKTINEKKTTHFFVVKEGALQSAVDAKLRQVDTSHKFVVSKPVLDEAPKKTPWSRLKNAFTKNRKPSKETVTAPPTNGEPSRASTEDKGVSVPTTKGDGEKETKEIVDDGKNVKGRREKRTTPRAVKVAKKKSPLPAVTVTTTNLDVAATEADDDVEEEDDNQLSEDEEPKDMEPEQLCTEEELVTAMAEHPRLLESTAPPWDARAPIETMLQRPWFGADRLKLHTLVNWGLLSAVGPESKSDPAPLSNHQTAKPITFEHTVDVDTYSPGRKSIAVHASAVETLKESAGKRRQRH